MPTRLPRVHFGPSPILKVLEQRVTDRDEVAASLERRLRAANFITFHTLLKGRK